MHTSSEPPWQSVRVLLDATSPMSGLGVGCGVGLGVVVVDALGVGSGVKLGCVGLAVGASEQRVAHDSTHAAKEEEGHAPTHAYGGEFINELNNDY